MVEGFRTPPQQRATLETWVILRPTRRACSRRFGEGALGEAEEGAELGGAVAAGGVDAEHRGGGGLPVLEHGDEEAGFEVGRDDEAGGERQAEAGEEGGAEGEAVVGVEGAVEDDELVAAGVDAILD